MSLYKHHSSKFSGLSPTVRVATVRSLMPKQEAAKVLTKRPRLISKFPSPTKCGGPRLGPVRSPLHRPLTPRGHVSEPRLKPGLKQRLLAECLKSTSEGSFFEARLKHSSHDDDTSSCSASSQSESFSASDPAWSDLSSSWVQIPTPQPSEEELVPYETMTEHGSPDLSSDWVEAFAPPPFEGEPAPPCETMTQYSSPESPGVHQCHGSVGRSSGNPLSRNTRAEQEPELSDVDSNDSAEEDPLSDGHSAHSGDDEDFLDEERQSPAPTDLALVEMLTQYSFPPSPDGQAFVAWSPGYIALENECLANKCDGMGDEGIPEGRSSPLLNKFRWVFDLAQSPCGRASLEVSDA